MVVRFLRSTVVLTGGLVLVALFTLTDDAVSLQELGLSTSVSWLKTAGLAVAWLALMLGYSPMADRFATNGLPVRRLSARFAPCRDRGANWPPASSSCGRLADFSRNWCSAESVLHSIEASASARLAAPPAIAVPVGAAAALGAGVIHLYEGPRAAIFVTQLAVLFDQFEHDYALLCQELPTSAIV